MSMRLELNHDGIRELLTSPEMLDVVMEHANRIASGLGDGYEVTGYTGSGRVNASIKAVSQEAINDNLENNTLLKAIGK